MVDPSWILFADLDGTLLDEETCEPGPSLEALERCRSQGIPVVLCSSKTGAEIRRYHERHSTHPGSPFIAENGGGVFFPADRWDRPYLVKRADGTHDPEIPSQGGIRFMPGVGPFGFLESVDDLLMKIRDDFT
jgi:mannosyl-3-phosphoglycerate phosphatase